MKKQILMALIVILATVSAAVLIVILSKNGQTVTNPVVDIPKPPEYPLVLPDEQPEHPLTPPNEQPAHPLALPVEQHTYPLVLPVEQPEYPLVLPEEQSEYPIVLTAEQPAYLPSPTIVQENLSTVDVYVDSKSACMEYSYGRSRKSVSHYSYDSEDNESYSMFSENRFKNATFEPLSTFSLDVDVASYSNVRRMINQGQKPPIDAVRTEQLINYFSYDYPNPTGKHPVNILTETQLCPWNKEHLLVRIGVKAKEIPSDNLPASNFVFLIDVSGSMYSANRLPLVKSSLKLLTNNLREKDRVAIVVYAGAVGEILPSTSGADKQKILEALDALEAGGSTAGGEGIELAYRVARKNFIQDGNNRIILCTDGDFNVGVSSERALEKLIEEKRKTGVYLTVLGYGMGNYKDSKLQILSQKGNGNHAYIDNIQEANRVLVQEFGSTMYAVAKDVKMQIEFNPAYINAYRLIGYESRLLNNEDFNDDTKDAGELGAGHTVTALYEIIPVGIKNRYAGSVDSLKYQSVATSNPSKGVLNNEMMTVKLRYKPIGNETSVKMEIPVRTGDVFKTPSADFVFASAVAMFGQLLRNSDFKGNATCNDVITLARKGLGEDERGYRREFVRIVEGWKGL